ncbi:hypothetical protein Goshw_007186 [Gossypium schwendimanii]|uniref:BED-type domain-containing protein n=1 Tax=Gossypium schwendimanii TaxID=34291 RepID=A0A7J9N0D2_GOSSC|nr:hypothetical protein [Gossypium schwendimanii]
MSYNSEQRHYSCSCTGFSSPMTVIEGNKISYARDTTHERPTPKETESLDDIEVATYMLRNRKKTSIVWQELAVVKLADGTKRVQCNHCNIKLSKNKDGTTTQYKRHLDGCVKHRLSLKGQDNLFLPPQTPRSNSASGIQTWKYDQAKIREVVSHMIIVHELHFAFIVYELFTLLMKNASPYYVRISRATVKADCWTCYEVEKKRLNGLLKTVDRISITTNMWKLGQKIQYMVLTAYFVDSNWNLQKRVLNFVDVPPLYSGVFNDAAIRMLKDSLSFHKRLCLNGKLFHVRCCAHILILLVHDGLSKFEDVIDNVRENVKHIIASTMHLTMFSDIEAPRQIRIVRHSLYELYKEYMDEYVATNVGTSMENGVQESGVNNASTTSRIGKGKVMTGRRSFDTIGNVKSKLDIDLEEGVFICKENYGDFDALEWWKVNNLKF